MFIRPGCVLIASGSSVSINLTPPVLGVVSEIFIACLVEAVSSKNLQSGLNPIGLYFQKKLFLSAIVLSKLPVAVTLLFVYASLELKT